jgi:hypothetical protein
VTLADPPGVDVVAGFPITVMVYPQTDGSGRIAVVLHWPPHIDPHMIVVALSEALNSVQGQVAALPMRALVESPPVPPEPPPLPAIELEAPNPPVDDQPWSMHCRACGAAAGEPHAPDCPAQAPPPPDREVTPVVLGGCPICHSTPHRAACPFNTATARPADANGAAPPMPPPQMCNECGQPLATGHRPNCPVRLRMEIEAVAERNSHDAAGT